MELGNSAAFFGSLAALVTALAGAYALWRKLRPETTNIQVTSADTLIALTRDAATFVGDERDRLADRVRDLESKLASFERRVVEAEDRAEAAENRANQSESKVTELTQENGRLRDRVQHLEEEVQRLRNQKEEEVP